MPEISVPQTLHIEVPEPTNVVIPVPDTSLEALAARLGYRHEQDTPAAEWEIEHNLGYRPAGVFVQDTAGTEHQPSINHVDENTVVLTFIGAMDGYAILS